MHIVAGIYRHRTLTTLKGQATRPSSSRLRESIFNICQNWIEGSHFLDLFAGSGAMGLEALSRGAQDATFIEKSREALVVIKKNIAHLGCQHQSTTLQGDVLLMLDKLCREEKTFDIIFVDPPYGLKHKEGNYAVEVASYLNSSELLPEGSHLFIEEGSPGLFPPLPHLELKSERKYGSSYLYHFVKL